MEIDSKALIIDNSRLSAYRTCIRKGYNRYDLGLTTEYTDAPLNFGGAIHAGIAHFTKTGNEMESLKVALASMQPQEWNEKEYRTPDLMVKVLGLLFKEKLPTPLFVDGKPVVEKNFVWPLVEETEDDAFEMTELLQMNSYSGLYYGGKIDLLGIWDDKLLVVDYKTKGKLEGNSKKGETKRIPANWWDTFRPHGATPMYCWGASKIVGKPITSVMIFGIGFDQYGIAFGKQIYELTLAEIEEARVRVIQEVKHYLTLKSQGLLDKVFNPDSCHDYMKPCPYLQMCRVDPANRESMKGLYKVEHWDFMKEEDES